jgi:hypothetical protein
MSETITEDQGDEIIRLLKKIVDRLEEIDGNTSRLPTIAGSLEQVQKNVFDIWLKG